MVKANIMTDNYKIVLQIDSKCEKEFVKNKIDPSTYYEKIISYVTLFYENGHELHIQKINTEIQSRLYFETTLYSIKLGFKERALITIDEDELFDQLIITVLAFTETHDYEKMFRKIGESMYQKYLNNGENKYEL